MESQEAGTKYVDDFIASLKVGEPDSYANLAVFPVFSERAGEDGYRTLDEAIKTKKFTVTEVSDGGHVPELKVVNGLDSDVLVVDGEELVGAKQNRIVNTTIIVGKGQAIVIPVSCVERSRWHARSKAFSAGKGHLYAELRKKKMRAVHANLRECRSYQADQFEIWQDIREKVERLSVDSKTEAMSDIYESYDKDLKGYEEAFKPRPGQVGFIAVIEGKVVGFDIFGIRSMLPKVYAKLLRGYILDALDRRMAKRAEKEPEQAEKAEKEVVAEVKKFLLKVKRAKRETFKAVGEGSDIRFTSKTVDGFALADGQSVIHMAAFAE